MMMEEISAIQRKHATTHATRQNPMGEDGDVDVDVDSKVI